MNNIPDLCEKCHKYHNSKFIKSCDVCLNFNFHENILCDSTRHGQSEAKQFECSAFRPLLSVLNQEKIERLEEEKNKENRQSRHLKDKWSEAYAMQNLKNDPDQVYFKIKFHICLCTIQRNKIFSDTGQYIGILTDIFQAIEKQFDATLIRVLWLEEDHIHLYVDTTPDYSLHEIVNKVIASSEKQILERFTGLQKTYKEIWERECFSETIG